ncbi:transmembrane protein, putative [Medicago truncatula]|uniref:Transmembrane protein, putative n=1 Tax=Medicago truncatula TaxID=3880 RepID=A0A072UGW3_MEDTR|nr:transmembrane protein, putative [Medicago truncatula]
MNSVKLERCSKVSAGRIVVRGLASMSEWKEMKRKGKKGVLNHSGRIEVRISYNHFSSFWVMFVFMSFGYAKSVENLLLMHEIHC